MNLANLKEWLRTFSWLINISLRLILIPCNSSKSLCEHNMVAVVAIILEAATVSLIVEVVH